MSASPALRTVSPHVFARNSKAAMPIAVGGEGPYLIDRDGKRYLDACGGAAVSCLGHQPQPVIEAIKRQLDHLAYAHTAFFTSEPAEALAERLAHRAPGELNRVYIVSGGSEAMEAALKLARQYHLEKGEPQRRHFIARRQSYHGNTLGALSAGGNMWRREPFEPLMVPVMHHVDPCHHWRWGQPGESEAAYAHRLAEQLEAKIQDLGPDTVAAFIAEPVVGATMGAVPPVPGYFRAIREVCDRHGVLLILDEVMCGSGRTGTWFAHEQEPGSRPDIVAIAKGLGGGLQPIAAMLCTEAVHDAIRDGSGFFQHGHTYLGHPAACAAALAVLDEVEGHDLLGNVQRQSAVLMDELRAAFGQHPKVGDIRGRGFFIGLELVADRESKAPLDPALGTNKALKAAAMARGLMIYPGGGTIDGRHGDHVLLAPPYILSDTHRGELMDKLTGAMTDVLG